MSLPAGFPSEDSTFNSVGFWLLNSDGRYAPIATDGETTTVGQTVVTRYTKPKTTQLSGLCSNSEAVSLNALVGSSHSLVLPTGTVTALLTACAIKYVDRFSVAEVDLSFVI